jgi:hypothetical protein
MIIYRKSAMSESSKAAKQQPVIEEVTPSVAAASVPPPAVRTCMTACSNADASTLLDEFFNMWRVGRIWRLNKKVTSPPSLLQDTCSLADFFIFVYVALTAKLEAAKKALADEKTARQLADRSLADERAARQTTD